MNLETLDVDSGSNLTHLETTMEQYCQKMRLSQKKTFILEADFFYLNINYLFSTVLCFL